MSKHTKRGYPFQAPFSRPLRGVRGTSRRRPRGAAALPHTGAWGDRRYHRAGAEGRADRPGGGTARRTAETAVGPHNCRVLRRAAAAGTRRAERFGRRLRAQGRGETGRGRRQRQAEGSGAQRSAAQRQVRKGAGSPRAALDGSRRRWWAASCRARRVGGMEAAAPLSPSSTAVPRSPFPGGSAHLPRGCGTWLPRPPLATSLGATPLSLALRLTAGLSGARFPRAALSAGRFPSAF